MSATTTPQWFRRRPDPMQSLFARAGISFIALFHTAYFVVALATLSWPQLAIGIGLPFLWFAMWLIWRGVPSEPGRSYGGGLIKKVPLRPGEVMLLDVPVRWGRWPGTTMGHLLISDQRLVVSPFSFGGPAITESPLDELRSVTRNKPAGLLARFLNEGDNIELMADRTFRLGPTAGFGWMGGYSADALESDVRGALDRAGWKPVSS